MKNVLERARTEGYAIPQFNINNLEWTRYILEACEEEKSPVILGASESAIKYIGGYTLVRHLVDDLIKELNITVPVILHLDHGSSLLSCLSAYEAGFDSIMIDASSLSFTENVALTNKVKSFCRNAIIEGEIGSIDTSSSAVNYTTFSEATSFYEQTKVDLLAPSVGSVHGIYQGEPNINFKIIEDLSQENIYLVLHGSSGLTPEIITKCRQSGIIKFNFNTELQIAWAKEVRKFLNENKTVYDPRKIISSGALGLKKVIKNYIFLLGSKNKG